MMRGLSRPRGQIPFSALFLFAAPLCAATFTVTNTADSGPGTLRQAILDANGNAGTDTIAFSIPGGGVHTVQPSSPLPAITDPVLVDGYTQPGSSPNTLSIGDNAVLLIEIDGAGAGLVAALVNVPASATTIRGLIVINAQGGDGVALSGGGSQATGNFIGVRADGVTAAGNGCAGVRASSPANTIGGSSPGDRNVIAATQGCGIDLVISGTNNFVLGNYIGTNAAGTAALGGTIGIDVTGTAHILGGSSSGAGNLISGHSGDGIRIRDGSSGNLIRGNFIGTNATGTAALSNSPGISITDSPNNVMGGSSPGARNVISGNFEGLVIAGNASAGNVIQGNFIGTNASGSSGVGNALRGVGIDDAPNTIVGGALVGSGNVVSGNQIGLKIASPGAAGTFIGGNLIGLNATGTAAIPNLAFGISIFSAANTSIGSGSTGSRNVISGNGASGVSLGHADSTHILGNFIGTDLAGTVAIPNNVAISDDSSSALVIGSAAPGAGNLISGNFGGVLLSSSRNASIRGNTIGTNVSENAVLANTGPGLALISTIGTAIGGVGAGDGNLVSASGIGIEISQGASTLILGNWIGTDRTSTLSFGNQDRGILAEGAANIGDGTAGGANTIAFNGYRGVAVVSTNGVSVRRNRIFANDSNPFIGIPGMGIDLENDGPTPNDPGDTDSGANGLQNFPVIRSTTEDSSNTTIVGSFNSMPSTAYTLEFYSNPVCSPSSYGEGKTFVGSTMLTTDSSGNASFNVTFSTADPSETVITATATDPNGNTSEFSACATVPSRFYTVAPCRLIDTRGPSGPYGGPSLAAGADRSFVLGSQCGIPSTATAVALNVVAVLPTDGPGFLTLWPSGLARPLAATINYNTGNIRANNAIIPLGALQDITVHCGQGTGSVDMVIDVNGYFQ